MNAKKYLGLGLALVLVSMAIPAMADDAAEKSNDKMGGNANSTYSAGASNNSGTPDLKDSHTVPSGKRHRTHKKHGTKAESADASRTINAHDTQPN
jgi:hypothetical protein